MLFNSLEFALFFPIVAVIYFMLPQQLRTLHLLVSSCIFYMAFIPAYILILALTIIIDYSAGIYLEIVSGKSRVWLLRISIIATCLVLFVFKYFYFFINSFIDAAGLLGWQLSTPTIDIILPIGLSFHTFQSLSYVIEVYYGRQKAETNFLTYATYVMFFPQLVAGPIERPQNLLHQFYQKHPFDYERITSGLKRMAWGFFKKLVIADRLALYVNDVYAAPQNFSGLQLIMATVFFAYQIYCDFSGYSDIAIGSARVLGFKLMENFDRPYASLSVAEFWKRWHNSLSTWFKDYVYIPLGGNRVSKPRHYLNLLITFGISGLWHGANWTYIVWGLLNGVYLIAETNLKILSNPVFTLLRISDDSIIRKVLRLAFTFVLTCAAWVVFRAKCLDDVWYIYINCFKGWDFGAIGTEQFLLRQMPVAIFAIMFLETVQFLKPRVSFKEIFAGFPQPLRWSVYLIFVLLVILFGVYRKTQFIYFQF